MEVSNSNGNTVQNACRVPPTKVKRIPAAEADMLQELADKLGLTTAEAYRRYGGRSIERAYRRLVLPELQHPHELGNPVG